MKVNLSRSYYYCPYDTQQQASSFIERYDEEKRVMFCLLMSRQQSFQNWVIPPIDQQSYIGKNREHNGGLFDEKGEG